MIDSINLFSYPTIKDLFVYPLAHKEYLDHSYMKKPYFDVGDSISFFPDIELDGYRKTDENDFHFQHIILNVYEFSFLPIFSRAEDIKTGLTDYILQIADKFLAYNFTFIDYHDRPLEIDQWYRGYGKLMNLWDNDPFEDYQDVSSDIRGWLKKFKIKAKVEKILDYDICRTWKDNKDTSIYNSKGDPYSFFHCVEKRTKYKYFTHYDKFKKAICSYRKKHREILSTDECLLPTYQLRIL
jgi:hypothetical protein